MKRLTLIFVLFVATISCSSDDDAKQPPEELSVSERLVNGSPWNFRNAEIKTVIQNSANITNEQMLFETELNSFPSFDFKENGNVTLVDGSTEINASYDIINGVLFLTANDGSTLELTGFEWSGSANSIDVFNFDSEYDYYDLSTGLGAFWEAIIYYE